MQKLLTTKELAKYLGIAPYTLHQYRTKGNGPRYIKLGRLVRYDIDDVQEWINEKTREKIYQQD